MPPKHGGTLCALSHLILTHNPMKSVLLSIFCIERNGFSEVEWFVRGTKLGVFPFDTAGKTKALIICICI